MLALHRIGVYRFFTIFFVMTYFMIARLRGSGADNPGVSRSSSPGTTERAWAMPLEPSGSAHD
jgi:hypothetical protein